SAAQAQFGSGGARGGRPPGGGMQGQAGPPDKQSRNIPTGNFFEAELKDGTKVSGSGAIKVKNDISVLHIKIADGKELSYTPSQVTRLSRTVRGSAEDFINFENKYWLCKINKNVEQFYQA